MKSLGLLLAGIALLAANQPATACAETEAIDGVSDANGNPLCIEGSLSGGGITCQKRG